MSGHILFRYIAARFAGAIGMILASAVTLIFFVNLAEVLRNHGGGEGFTFWTGVVLTAFQTPAMIDDLLPFVFLFAAMLTLLNLSRKLELVVARATGVSAWQFLAPVIAVALLFGALSAGVINPLALTLRARAEAMEARLGDTTMMTSSSLWLRQRSVDGSSILGAVARDPATGDLLGVRAFLYGAKGHFEEKVEAARAGFADGVWTLKEATVFSSDLPPQAQATYLLASDLDADELERTIGASGLPTVWALPGMIETGRATGFNVDRSILTFNSLLARPLFFLAMVLIAGCVSLRLFRYGGVIKLALAGIASGFVLYVFTKIVHDLGVNGILDPVLAAWMPPILALTLGSTTLLVQEDG